MSWISNYTCDIKKLYNNLKYRTQNRYYELVPYGWRLKRIITYFKNRWYKHTTIKPRTLGHEGCDKTELLPHLMFECLSQFIEEECSPGIVDWYSNEPCNKFDYNGEQKYGMDELLDLYYWWNFVYLKEYPETEEILWKEVSQNEPIHYGKDKYWKPTFDDENKELAWHRCMDALNQLDHIMFVKLDEQAKRLINVRMFMWT